MKHLMNVRKKVDRYNRRNSDSEKSIQKKKTIRNRKTQN